MGSWKNALKALGTIFVPIALTAGASILFGQRAALVVLFSFFGLVGAALAASALGRILAYGRLRGSAAVAPAEVTSGTVELEGTAKPLEETLDPPRADDAECLVYRHRIQKKRTVNTDDGTEEQWRTVKNDVEDVPFVVEGQQSSVVVDPTDAELILEDDYEQRGTSRREYVKRLDPGESVYVAGVATHATAYDGRTAGHQFAVTEPSSPLPDALQRLYDTPFLISDSSETTAQRKLLFRGLKILGLALFYNGLFLFFVIGILGPQRVAGWVPLVG